MKTLFTNLLIIMFGLFISLVFCEFGARFVLPKTNQVQVDVQSRTPSDSPEKNLSDDTGSIMPVMDWSGKNGVRLNPNVTATIHNHTLSHQDVVLRINSLGLRYRELAPNKGDEFRILAIGDSITFGDYVDESQTYPTYLEQNLTTPEKPIAVINAGLPGANTSDEFHHYMEIQNAVKPDVVMVGMYLNDANDSQQFYAQKLRFPFSQSRFLTWLVERLHLLNTDSLLTSVHPLETDPDWREKFRNGRNLHSDDMLASRDGFDYEIYNAHKDFGLAWNPESWKNLTEITDTFSKAVEQNNQRFIITLLPIHIQVYGNESTIDRYPQEQFKKMCSSLGLTCLDLLPGLRSEVQSSGLKMSDMYYDHCHMRDAGNKITARLITNWLHEQKIY